MKVYAHKDHYDWLKGNKDEGRTRCITIYSFRKFDDDIKLELTMNKGDEQ